jgi:outer membrane receptor protein involved in Fe transport
VLNASVYWAPTDNGLRFTLWGRNLGNQKYVTNTYSSAQQVTYQAAAPLTWGVSAEQKF